MSSFVIIYVIIYDTSCMFCSAHDMFPYVTVTVFCLLIITVTNGLMMTGDDLQSPTEPCRCGRIESIGSLMKHSEL